jgi:hypothetical protein
MGRKNLHEAFQQIEAQKRAQREKEAQAEREARLRAEREAEQRTEEERRAREAEAAALPPPDADVSPLGGLFSAEAGGEARGAAEPDARAAGGATSGAGSAIGAGSATGSGSASASGEVVGATPRKPGRPAGAPASSAGRGATGASAARNPGAAGLRDVLAQPVVLALFLLVFACGFLSGRLTTPAVGAAGPNGGSGSALAGPDGGSGERPASGAEGARGIGPAVPGANAARRGDPTAGEALESDPVLARLFDPGQSFTIQLISYNDSEYTRRLSEELVTYLRALDFQASPPLKVGDKLTVLVGAEASREGLAPTLAALRRTPGPNGASGAFDGAMVRSIDDLLGRE